MKSPIAKVRKHIRSNLFFVEMIIVLLFFSIASAVILRSFAASDRLAKESRRIESMAFLAQSAAEIYSGTADISETAEKLLSGKPYTYNEYPDGSQEISFSMDTETTVRLRESSEIYAGGPLKILEISFSDGSGGILYETKTGAYFPERTVTDSERQ